MSGNQSGKREKARLKRHVNKLSLQDLSPVVNLADYNS